MSLYKTEKSANLLSSYSPSLSVGRIERPGGESRTE